MIVGIDEVGRGCWAGPLCVGAVVLGDSKIDGLNDSKLLSAKKRNFLAGEIKTQAAGIGIGWASAAFIDTYGMSKALTYASKIALQQITLPVSEIIIDGTVNILGDPRVTTLKKADQLIGAVSAASIVAKVARDRYMQHLDMHLPNYQFARHVGYGTALHRQLLDEFGPSPVHRMSFAPLKEISRSDLENKDTQRSGARAEEVAVKFLQNKGFTIIEQNWRTKWCEVDIVAEKDGRVHFVEVKYRKTARQGGGLEYITTKKQRQMRFAAELWMGRSREKIPHCLSALEVSGSGYLITNWIPVLILAGQ